VRAQHRSFAGALIGLKTGPGTLAAAGTEASYAPAPAPGEEDLRFEPWTIRNKYYSADVHFALVDTAGWRVRYAVGAPAVVYVWEEGTVRPARLHVCYTAC
jgi:hypothetical protein